MQENAASIPEPNAPRPPPERWLDLQEIAYVEVTSEDAEHPIQFAFLPDSFSEWRAARKGQQTVRLHFAKPITIQRIWLQLVDPDHERTQEFTLNWAPGRYGPYRLVARQQWSFRPQSCTEQIGDYRVELNNVRALELVIRPDLGRGQAFATIARWAMA